MKCPICNKDMDKRPYSCVMYICKHTSVLILHYNDTFAYCKDGYELRFYDKEIGLYKHPKSTKEDYDLFVLKDFYYEHGGTEIIRMVSQLKLIKSEEEFDRIMDKMKINMVFS